jgi:hypothetical protein
MIGRDRALVVSADAPANLAANANSIIFLGKLKLTHFTSFRAQTYVIAAGNIGIG